MRDTFHAAGAPLGATSAEVFILNQVGGSARAYSRSRAREGAPGAALAGAFSGGVGTRGWHFYFWVWPRASRGGVPTARHRAFACGRRYPIARTRTQAQVRLVPPLIFPVTPPLRYSDRPTRRRIARVLSFWLFGSAQRHARAATGNAVIFGRAGGTLWALALLHITGICAQHALLPRLCALFPCFGRITGAGPPGQRSDWIVWEMPNSNIVAESAHRAAGGARDDPRPGRHSLSGERSDPRTFAALQTPPPRARWPASHEALAPRPCPFPQLTFCPPPALPTSKLTFYSRVFSSSSQMAMGTGTMRTALTALLAGGIQNSDSIPD